MEKADIDLKILMEVLFPYSFKIIRNFVMNLIKNPINSNECINSALNYFEPRLKLIINEKLKENLIFINDGLIELTVPNKEE